MEQSHDVVIVGLGAMGSAAAYHLSRRGQRVLGLDRFSPPHELGSSHGQTRIIREAYFEHPLYVPLVQRAYVLWDELEKATGRTLLQKTGGLMIGPAGGELVSGALQSARTYHLPHKLLTGTEVRQRYPIFQVDDETTAVWEPRAGVLFPEICIETYLALARKQGARLCFDERVTGWQAEGDGVRVNTTQAQYRADRLLLTAGAWMTSLVPELSQSLTVERTVLHWFEPTGRADTFSPDRFPIYAWEVAPGRIFYGFPDMGEGVKVARHHQGEAADPDTLRRQVTGEEVQAMRGILDRHMPDASGALLNTAVCMYTNTPDFHFLLDFHPTHPQVLICSPCSGHGFKFASVIGEILTDLLLTGRTSFDISLFRAERLMTG
jgi:sarcosine oxidase